MARLMELTTVAATAGVILAFAPAAAQSPCGPTYTVTAGDTLYRIARNCDTTVEALVQANEQITDPARIEVGWALQIPDGAGSAEHDPDRTGPAAPDAADGTYRVEPGDTLHAIARRLGTTLSALLAANEDVDPARLAIGQLLQLPGAAPPPDRGEGESVQASVSPDAAARGEQVTVSGSNFRPGESVRVAAGLPDAEYQVIATTQADAQGEVNARVRVPDWADPGRNLAWVLVTDDRREAFARGFRVVEQDQPDTIEVTGVLTREGVECPALRTDRGDLYTLAGDTGRFDPGDRVRVRGPRAEVSFCQQGTTIEVRSVEDAE